jgi:hypothetical protein
MCDKEMATCVTWGDWYSQTLSPFNFSGQCLKVLATFAASVIKPYTMIAKGVCWQNTLLWRRTFLPSLSEFGEFMCT